ncbi:cytochrome P450 [Fomitopsis serialis]|uniref:cytochrome P450 n=1 Tax=Fomitopsis serialis TaxID=139415 RepID=UPI00200816BB|nr:cytochrome P450 [Neoantrodia serialis]KAH9936562.1 cytochrome P450 [Neoantrodia serialis]
MLSLTPGLRLLLRFLSSLIIPTVFIYGAARLAEHGIIYDVPTWVLAFAWIAYLPLTMAVRSVITWVQEERDIRRLGAVPIPAIKGRLPGNMDVVARLKTRTTHERIESLQQEHGIIFNTRLMAQNRIFTADPNHIKSILATDFNIWEKGHKFRADMASVLGSGVVDGVWNNSLSLVRRFHRSMTRPFFARDRITDFEIFARHADEAIAVIRARQGNPIDFQDVLQRFTLDSSTEFLLGKCVNSLHALLPASYGKIEIASLTAEAFGPALNRMAAWPLFEILEDKTTHPKLIADEVLNILIAGRDTTSTTLTFLVYLLSVHPHVLVRLREEILSRVGPSRYPDFEDMREMKYTRAVINETMRLFPAVPVNIRSNVRATTLPSNVPGGKPYYVPANSEVAYFVVAMQRSKDVWGPDADEFDPSRFLDERLQKYVLSNPFNFVPFNAGPRICLGQQLALDAQPAEAKPPVKWASGSGKAIEKLIPKSALTLYVKGGLWMRFEEATAEA